MLNWNPFSWQQLIFSKFPSFFRFPLLLAPAVHLLWSSATRFGSRSESPPQTFLTISISKIHSSHRDHNKKLSIVRFNTSLGIGFKKWTHPKLERDTTRVRCRQRVRPGTREEVRRGEQWGKLLFQYYLFWKSQSLLYETSKYTL